jgi:hypothetical protein
VEWHLGLGLFFWCVVENSQNPEDRSEKGPAQQIQKTSSEYSDTNKCMLTFKHGTLGYSRAKQSYPKEDDSM